MTYTRRHASTSRSNSTPPRIGSATGTPSRSCSAANNFRASSAPIRDVFKLTPRNAPPHWCAARAAGSAQCPPRSPEWGTTSSTVSPGQPASYTFSMGGEGGISGTVAFSCSGAPSEATCTVSPNPATLGGSATTVTVTVTTTAPTLMSPRSPRLPPAYPDGQGGRRLLLLALVLLAMMVWATRRGNQMGLRGSRLRIVLLASGLLLVLGLAGCGGGGGGGSTPNPGTPAGTYSLTVTGTTGSGASAVSHAVTLKLTVS